MSGEFLKSTGIGRQACVAVLGAGLACLALTIGCATQKATGMDPGIKVFTDGADAAYRRGELERADALYTAALQRARLTDNTPEIARCAYNLALCRMAGGKPVEARNLLQQAGALVAGQGGDEARILLAEAEAARLSGEVVESGELARRAVTVGVDEEGRVQALLIQAEAAMASGSPKEARTTYQTAIEKVTRLTAPPIRARLDGLAAGLVQAQVLSGDLGVIQLSRAEWLRKSDRFGEMVAALNAAGDAFERVENWPRAFSCRIRAAQSLLAAGMRDKALQAARQALDLSGKTGDMNHKTLATAILNDLK